MYSAKLEEKKFKKKIHLLSQSLVLQFSIFIFNLNLSCILQKCKSIKAKDEK